MFNFIVEQNRDAQLRSLLTLETSVAKDRLRSVLVYGGFPLSAKRVIDEIGDQLETALPITKPVAIHPSLHRNQLGLTIRDYEGSMSTLCAGCGHDSITAAIVRACWELSLAPHMIAKMSGIGCSSKTPTYFVSGAHGFNSAHGRMAAIATGANAANRELTYIGISGDGDSLSIGLGHMCHAIRRNVKMLYVIENNGVYGLTKGQFSASADVGSKSKRGEPNRMAPIDPVMLGLSLGATFVARSFSGDKEQLVPILKAGLAHRGFAMVDVISPCVTFNDHVGSTKSYLYTRNNMLKVNETDFVPPASEILATIGQNGAVSVAMHDGSVVRFKGVPPGLRSHRPRKGLRLPAGTSRQRRGGDGASVPRRIGRGSARVEPDVPTSRYRSFRTKSCVPARRRSTSCRKNTAERQLARVMDTRISSPPSVSFTAPSRNSAALQQSTELALRLDNIRTSQLPVGDAADVVLAKNGRFEHKFEGYQARGPSDTPTEPRPQGAVIGGRFGHVTRPLIPDAARTVYGIGANESIRVWGVTSNVSRASFVKSLEIKSLDPPTMVKARS